MTLVHSRVTEATIDGEDLTPYLTACVFTRDVSTVQLPACDPQWPAFAAGPITATVALEGLYDSDSDDGPAAILVPLLDGYCGPYPFVRRPEGTGALLPQQVMDVFVTRYVESSPIADMVTFQCDLQVTGPIDSTPQGS